MATPKQPHLVPASLPLLLRGLWPPLYPLRHKLADIEAWVNSLSADEMRLIHAWLVGGVIRPQHPRAVSDTVVKSFSIEWKKRYYKLCRLLGVVDRAKQLGATTETNCLGKDHSWALEHAVDHAILARLIPAAHVDQVPYLVQNYSDSVALVEHYRRDPSFAELVLAIAPTFEGNFQELTLMHTHTKVAC